MGGICGPADQLDACSWPSPLLPARVGPRMVPQTHTYQPCLCFACLVAPRPGVRQHGEGGASTGMFASEVGALPTECWASSRGRQASGAHHAVDRQQGAAGCRLEEHRTQQAATSRPAPAVPGYMLGVLPMLKHHPQVPQPNKQLERRQEHQTNHVLHLASSTTAVQPAVLSTRLESASHQGVSNLHFPQV